MFWHENWHDDLLLPDFELTDIEPKKTTALTLVVNKLRKYTNYTVVVLAYTSVGDGVLAKPIFCRTDEDGKKSILFYFYF